MAETIFWWTFLFACIFAFFFGYGIVENLIRRWASRGRSRKQRNAPRIANSPDPRGNGHADSMLH